MTQTVQRGDPGRVASEAAMVLCTWLRSCTVPATRRVWRSSSDGDVQTEAICTGHLRDALAWNYQVAAERHELTGPELRMVADVLGATAAVAVELPPELAEVVRHHQEATVNQLCTWDTACEGHGEHRMVNALLCGGQGSVEFVCAMHVAEAEARGYRREAEAPDVTTEDQP